jgi:hypothetical protein
MRPSTLLRTASVLTLVHCILHTIGGVLAPPSHGAEEIAVIETELFIAVCLAAAFVGLPRRQELVGPRP